MKLNIFIAMSFFLLTACGGGSDGSATSNNAPALSSISASSISSASVARSSAAVALVRNQDLMELFPVFYGGVLSNDAAYIVARGFINPFFSDANVDLLDECDEGSAKMSPVTKPFSNGTKIVITYANCKKIFNPQGEVVSISMETIKNGAITYELVNYTGDFLTSQKAFGANIKISFSAMTVENKISTGGAQPILMAQTLGGGVEEAYQYPYNYNDLNAGTIKLTGGFEVAATINKNTITSADKNLNIAWEFTEFNMNHTGSATFLTSYGKYAGKDIQYKNIVKNIFKINQAADYLDVANDIKIFTAPDSGVNELIFEKSKVIYTFSNDNVVLDIDLNGDGCAESSGIFTKKEMEDAYAVLKPLDSSRFVSVKSGCFSVSSIAASSASSLKNSSVRSSAIQNISSSSTPSLLPPSDFKVVINRQTNTVDASWSVAHNGVYYRLFKTGMNSTYGTQMVMQLDTYTENSFTFSYIPPDHNAYSYQLQVCLINTPDMCGSLSKQITLLL